MEGALVLLRPGPTAILQPKLCPAYLSSSSCTHADGTVMSKASGLHASANSIALSPCIGTHADGAGWAAGSQLSKALHSPRGSTCRTCRGGASWHIAWRTCTASSSTNVKSSHVKPPSRAAGMASSSQDAAEADGQQSGGAAEVAAPQRQEIAKQGMKKLQARTWW
jgi:hypothetical protein